MQRVVVRLVVRAILRKNPPEIADRVSEAMRMPAGLLTFSYFFILGFDAIKQMPPNLWMHVHSDLYPMLIGLLILICSFRIVETVYGPAQTLGGRIDAISINAGPT